MAVSDWEGKLRRVGAFWRHDGDPNKPHALLTSGKHSDGYYNGAKLVENPGILAEVIAGMTEKIEPYFKGEKPTYIMGPAMGAITLGHEMARQLGTKFAYTEIAYTDEGKMQVLKRFDIPEDVRVMIVEDAVSTGGSIKKTIDVLEERGVQVLPYIPIIIDWSGGAASALEGKQEIIPLLSIPMNIWEPDECELCKQGSQALRPKANWDRLNA